MMEDLKPIIARNLTDLRKARSWTQTELAEKLNYSDKAVSKWERAESVPDISVLKAIADLFGVTVDFLLQAEHSAPPKAVHPQLFRRRNRLLITLLSASVVFLVATILYVGAVGFAEMLLQRPFSRVWMIYVGALPVACVVLLVFNAVWGKRPINFIIISVLVWSVLLTVFLSLLPRWFWQVFLIGIPAQAIILLWGGLKVRR